MIKCSFFHIYSKLSLGLLALLMGFSVSANAQMSMIRDAQIENYLYKISDPIFSAANLKDQVKFYIIHDNNINAFVAGGKNIFINSGIISFSDSPLGLIGVIAHETGHIKGGHLARMSVDVNQIQKQLSLGYILGIATAILGSPDAGQAIILGSSHAGQRQFFSHSIKHEEAADEIALKLLDKSKINPVGLVDFFKEIRDMEKIYFDQIDPYTRTHPLTKDRINRIALHAEEYADTYVGLTPDLLSEFNIIKGKLIGFLEDPEKTLQNHKSKSNLDIMARAVAYHRLGKSDIAIEMLGQLKGYKDNPYILELIGQIYYESGQSKYAFNIFKKLDKILPDEPLIKIQYASVILALNDPRYFSLAIKKVNIALFNEKENLQAWRVLAELYSKLDNKGMMYLAIAETELISQNYAAALAAAHKAKEILKANEDIEALLRIKDVIMFAEKKQKNK